MHDAMRMAGCVILAVLLVGTACLCVGEIRSWRLRRSIISRGQLIVRLMGGGLTLILLGRVLFGILYVRSDVEPAIYFVRYWTNCFGLALLLCVVALADFWLVCRRRHHHCESLRGWAAGLFAERPRARPQPQGQRPGQLDDSRAESPKRTC